MSHTNKFNLFTVLILVLFLRHSVAFGQDLVGLNVVPHTQSSMLRWRRPANPELSARFELFFKNQGSDTITLTGSDPIRFDGQTPEQLLDSAQWAWHETPSVWNLPLELPSGSMMVWKINGHSASWGIGSSHEVQLGAGRSANFQLSNPEAYLSAVTFLAAEANGRLTSSPYPNQVVIHVANNSLPDLQIESFQLWVPDVQADGRIFSPLEMLEDCELKTFPSSGVIQPGGKAILVVDSVQPPLSHVLVEVRCRCGKNTASRSLWATLKVKSEQFDISGGWIAGRVGDRNTLTMEEYLKTLVRMHIDTGQIEEVAGYTDDKVLYQRYPFKRFNRLSNLSRYDTDDLLPTIHAVEFIGEPQFGGGRPVAPQEVRELLEPYRNSRLPTSVTLSEEHTWRYYAGLSDYPHYDAYRVVAPAADYWRAYDWDGQKIGWGAPLETIGEMTRSLRDHSRPAPIAYWSQGAHHNWGSLLNPRRGSPTADELRSQAWHGLANRITSLYWFNLSLQSLVKFPDLIVPITRVNREIRLLDEIFLKGDAWEHRWSTEVERPTWELASIADTESLLMTVHNLKYRPDPARKEFVFEQREGQWQFQLPAWLDDIVSVFSIGEQGPIDVDFKVENGSVIIVESVDVVGIFIATVDSGLRDRLSHRYQQLIKKEMSTGFDPGSDPDDLNRLKSLLLK